MAYKVVYKFQPGEIVFTIIGNEIQEVIISGIGMSNRTPIYNMRNIIGLFEEDNIYYSANELLMHLQDNINFIKK